MALTRSKDPLVWIDCEMTGLNPTTDKILSISCYITTPDLTLLDPTGYHATILTPPSLLSNMSAWCIETHTTTGLVAQCLDATTSVSADRASHDLLTYIQSHIPEARVGVLAGNTVHMDRMFLMQESEPWKKVVDHLHYRILDVSSFKEGVRRWCSEEVLRECPRKKECHVAKDDIQESIEEARFYMRLLQGKVEGRGTGEGGEGGK